VFAPNLLLVASTNTMSVEKAQERFISDQIAQKRNEYFASNSTASSRNEEPESESASKSRMIAELRRDLYSIPDNLKFDDVKQQRTEGDIKVSSGMLVIAPEVDLGPDTKEETKEAAKEAKKTMVKFSERAGRTQRR
jgi:hypothetical protein